LPARKIGKIQKAGSTGRPVTSPKHSLDGHSVLITRTFEGNLVEKKKLESYGAKVIELETIKICPPTSWKKLDHAISILDEFNWVVFTSANGVSSFFGRVSEKQKSKLLQKGSKLRFACVGSSTKKALENLGFISSFEPSEFLTKTLGKELAESFDIKGKKILLARAEDASDEITQIIKNAGGEVTEVPVYTTRLQKQEFSKSIIYDLTDITLTSPSAVEGFVRSVPMEEIKWSGIHIHCIGPVTARAAAEKGLFVYSVAEIHTIDGLIDSIIKKSSP
jgi:uroporphyrinogen-III synthase